MSGVLRNTLSEQIWTRYFVRWFRFLFTAALGPLGPGTGEPLCVPESALWPRTQLPHLLPCVRPREG